MALSNDPIKIRRDYLNLIAIWLKGMAKENTQAERMKTVLCLRETIEEFEMVLPSETSIPLALSLNYSMVDDRCKTYTEAQLSAASTIFFKLAELNSPDFEESFIEDQIDYLNKLGFDIIPF